MDVFFEMKMILKGILVTLFPNLYLRIRRKRELTGTHSARYCYTVWLRQLSLLHENGLNTNPEVIAELGPGSSIGAGLSGLLTGATRYYGFDVLDSANLDANLRVFEELVQLFHKRERIPDNSEFPGARPRLRSYEFPHQIITEERLDTCLAANRIGKIEKALLNANSSAPDEEQVSIRYFAPWDSPEVIVNESVDLIFSQAVLEHVTDLSAAYGAMFSWLKSGGVMSHRVDFRSHGLSKHWYGHWTYSTLAWKLIVGKRPYFINREPLSTHLRSHEKEGFEVVLVERDRMAEPERRHLAKEFRHLSGEDLSTRGAHILSRKL